MAWKTFEIREIRPNHFVTLNDGEVVRASTSFDHEFNKLFQRCQKVDAETVAMAFGLSALSAVLTAQATTLVLTFIGSLAFALCVIGSFGLFDGLITQKIPHLVYLSLEKTSKRPILRILQFRFNLYKQWIKAQTNFSELLDVEFAYLTLAVGSDIVLYSLIIWFYSVVLTPMS
jgi:hypothetical protein